MVPPSLEELQTTTTTVKVPRKGPPKLQKTQNPVA
jgi:hypothetical protein